MREVLGGGSGGRYYADGEDTIHVVPDSRNLPTEFTEARFPFVVERLGLAVDSGGAGPVPRRAGLREAHPDAARRALHVHRGPVDPGLLGGQGGKAGRPFEVTIDPGGPNERAVDALADAEPVRAGEVIRIRTTGGGGWGDPLDRPYDEVARDVLWGKVSVDGAARRLRRRRRRSATSRSSTRPPATRCAPSARGAPRPSSRSSTAARATPTLSGGATSADVDWL